MAVGAVQPETSHGEHRIMACRCHQIAFTSLQKDVREAIALGEADLAYTMTRHIYKLAHLLASGQ